MERSFRAAAFPTEETTSQPPGGETAACAKAALRLLLIVQSPMHRQCLEYMLRSRFRHCTIETTDSISACAADHPDVVLVEIPSLDIWTAGLREQIADLQTRCGGCPIVALSSEDNAELANATIRSGLRGFLPPTASIETVVAAVSLATAGGTYIPTTLIDLWTAPSPARQPEPPRPAAIQTYATLLTPDSRGFTRRELEVIDHLHQGKPNKIIAFELKMSESTAKVHMRNIMRKINASNRTQVASLTRGVMLRGTPAAVPDSLSDWRQRSAGDHRPSRLNGHAASQPNPQ